MTEVQLSAFHEYSLTSLAVMTLAKEIDGVYGPAIQAALPTVETPFRTFATDTALHPTPILFRLQKRSPTYGSSSSMNAAYQSLHSILTSPEEAAAEKAIMEELDSMPDGREEDRNMLEPRKKQQTEVHQGPAPETIHLHKRSPVFTSSSTGTLDEPLLPKAAKRSSGNRNVAFKLEDMVRNHLKKVANISARNMGLIEPDKYYTYSIPGVKALEESLERKRGTKGEQLAIARLKAVKNGDADSANMVMTHHEKKAVGLYNKDGEYDTKHKEFDSRFRNQVKSWEWDHLRRDLVYKQRQKKMQQQTLPDLIQLHKRSPVYNREPDKVRTEATGTSSSSSVNFEKKGIQTRKGLAVDFNPVTGNPVVVHSKLWEQRQIASERKAPTSNSRVEVQADIKAEPFSYTYSIPDGKVLKEDLKVKLVELKKAKEGTNQEAIQNHKIKVDIARARVAAVVNRNAEAAKQVGDYHNGKTDALLDSVKTEAGLDSQHPIFASFHKNDLKHTEWEELHRKLASEMRDKEVHLRSEPGAIRLHKRAPMLHRGSTSTGKLNEPLLKKDAGGSRKSAAMKAASTKNKDEKGDSFKYTIPGAKTLEEDLTKKQQNLYRVREGVDEELKLKHTKKVNIAEARVAAVKDNGANATRKVEEYHNKKAEAASERGEMAAYHKNWAKGGQWEDRRIGLDYWKSMVNAHAPKEPESMHLQKRAPVYQGWTMNDLETATDALSKGKEMPVSIRRLSAIEQTRASLEAPFNAPQYRYTIPSGNVLRNDLHENVVRLRKEYSGMDSQLKKQERKAVRIASARVAAVVHGDVNAAKKVEDYHNALGDDLFHSKMVFDLDSSRQNHAKGSAWRQLRESLAGGNGQRGVQDVGAQEPIHMHKRSPVKDVEGESRIEELEEPLLKDAWVIDIPKDIAVQKTRKRNAFLRGVDMVKEKMASLTAKPQTQEEIPRSYTIPKLDKLEKDLKMKQSRLKIAFNEPMKQRLRYKVDIAKARVAAVRDGNIEAADQVSNHHFGRLNDLMRTAPTARSGSIQKHYEKSQKWQNLDGSLHEAIEGLKLTPAHENPIHMHKRSPVKETKGESRIEQLEKPLLQNNAESTSTTRNEALQRTPKQNAILRGIDNVRGKMASITAKPKVEGPYKIPPFKVLDKDLKKKEQRLKKVLKGNDEEQKERLKMKVGVAKARVTAIRNRNVDAAYDVIEHHVGRAYDLSKDGSTSRLKPEAIVKHKDKASKWQELTGKMLRVETIRMLKRSPMESEEASKAAHIERTRELTQKINELADEYRTLVRQVGSDAREAVDARPTYPQEGQDTGKKPQLPGYKYKIPTVEELQGALISKQKNLDDAKSEQAAMIERIAEGGKATKSIAGDTTVAKHQERVEVAQKRVEAVGNNDKKAAKSVMKNHFNKAQSIQLNSKDKGLLQVDHRDYQSMEKHLERGGKWSSLYREQKAKKALASHSSGKA